LSPPTNPKELLMSEIIELSVTNGVPTPYDSYTKKYKHKGEHTFQAIRKHTLNAIATQYPHLKHECRKQKLKNNN
jgi:hypothetical protein